VRFPTLEETIACNEAVRQPDEASSSADDDDLERVARALDRAGVQADPIDAAAALAFEITRAQGFFEGNKRTAVLVARWFIRTNAGVDPDQVVPPDDRVFADLLIAAARGEDVGDQMRRLFRARVDRGER
jgi:prophage maintenance system killer protein